MQSVESGERALTRRSFLAVGAGALALLGTTACDNANNPYNLDGTANENAKPQDQADSTAEGTDPAADEPDTPDDYTLLESGTLSISLVENVAPFTYYDYENEEYAGYELDLINAIAQKLGLEAFVVDDDIQNDALFGVSKGAKADVAVGGIVTDTDDSVGMTDSTVTADLACVVRQDDVDSIGVDALNNSGGYVRVCTYTARDWVKENMSDKVEYPYNFGGAEEVNELEDFVTLYGDAMVVSQAAAYYVLTHTDSGVAIAKDGLITTGKSCGIAVSKDNPGLTKAINKALAELKADGTVDQLQTEWFGQVIGY